MDGGRVEEITDGSGDGVPGVVLVEVGSLAGLPAFEFSENSGGVKCGVPVQLLLIDGALRVVFVSAKESLGHPAGGAADDWLKRRRRLERCHGQEQRRKGDIVGAIGNLGGGPVEQCEVSTVGEDVEGVKIAVADHYPSWLRPGAREVAGGGDESGVAEFVGSLCEVVDEQIDVDALAGDGFELRAHRARIETVKASGYRSELFGQLTR